LLPYRIVQRRGARLERTVVGDEAGRIPGEIEIAIAEALGVAERAGHEHHGWTFDRTAGANE
jgi:hypothetical protein